MQEIVPQNRIKGRGVGGEVLSIGTSLVTELMQSGPETSGLHMRIAGGGGDGVGVGKCFPCRGTSRV